MWSPIKRLSNWLSKKTSDELLRAEKPEIRIKIDPPARPQDGPPEMSFQDEILQKRESEKMLQRLDELVTIAEEEISELMVAARQSSQEEKFLRDKLSQPKEEWEERSFLLKLERILVFKNNLLQKIEIYNQNIRVYLNLISQIQNIQAMKLGGIDESKIENLWIELKENIEAYKEKLSAQEAANEEQEIPLTTPKLESNIKALKEEIAAKRAPIKLEPVAPTEKPVANPSPLPKQVELE